MLRINDSRATRPYSRREYLGRALWGLVAPMFRFSPRQLHGWRSWLLRRFGAIIGKRVHIYPTVRIVIPWNLEVGDDSSIGDCALIYSLGKVRIGARATISHNAHLCAGTHDYLDPALPLLRQPISIGDDAWVCAQSFIGPGVLVANGAVVGAAAVVMKDVTAWTVVAGNPARAVKKREMRSVSST